MQQQQGDEEAFEYNSLLRHGIFEAYSGVLNGMSQVKCDQFLRPFVPVRCFPLLSLPPGHAHTLGHPQQDSGCALRPEPTCMRIPCYGLVRASKGPGSPMAKRTFACTPAGPPVCTPGGFGPRRAG